MKNALTTGNKVYLVDTILDKTHKSYRDERFYDMMFYYVNDGSVKTREYLESTFERNGFRVTNIRPAKDEWVIEAVVI